MRLDPGMIEAEVVRHEIQQQLQASFIESFPEARQPRLPAQFIGNPVSRNGVRRSANVAGGPARQDFVINPALIRMTDRGGTSAWSTGPHTHQPDMSETLTLPLFEFRIGNVRQIDRA